MTYKVEHFPQSINGILKTLDEHQYHYTYQASVIQDLMKSREYKAAYLFSMLNISKTQLNHFLSTLLIFFHYFFFLVLLVI